MRLTRLAVATVARWPRRSQDVARRNAMVASTELVARRRELLEVQEFIAVVLAGRAPAGVPTRAVDRHAG